MNVHKISLIGHVQNACIGWRCFASLPPNKPKSALCEVANHMAFDNEPRVRFLREVWNSYLSFWSLITAYLKLCASFGVVLYSLLERHFRYGSTAFNVEDDGTSIRKSASSYSNDEWRRMS